MVQIYHHHSGGPDSSRQRQDHARHLRRATAIGSFGREPREAIRDQREDRHEMAQAAVDRRPANESEGASQHCPIANAGSCHRGAARAGAASAGRRLHRAEGSHPTSDAVVAAPLPAMPRGQPLAKADPEKPKKFKNYEFGYFHVIAHGVGKKRLRTTARSVSSCAWRRHRA